MGYLLSKGVDNAPESTLTYYTSSDAVISANDVAWELIRFRVLRLEVVQRKIVIAVLLETMTQRIIFTRIFLL
jgi:hypothetical protein